MKLIIPANNEGYSTKQVREPMTVTELIEALQDYAEEDPNAKVYLEFDNGYTYGTISEIRSEDDDEESN